MGEAAQSVADEPAGESLLCLKCGYDLRGVAVERCSECGWEIDHDLLRGGSLPWERRRYRGRFLTYLETVWQVSVGSRKLADAAGRKHALADAKIFARLTGVILAIALVGIFFVTFGRGAIWRLAISAQTGWPPAPRRPVWVEELLVPWSAGVTLFPVAPVMLVVFAFALIGAARRLFASKDAIGCYAVAPLVWLVPVGFLVACLIGSEEVVPDRIVAVAMLLLAICIAAYGILRRLVHARRGTQPNIFFMPGMLAAGTFVFLIPLWLNDLGFTLRNMPSVLPLSVGGLVILLAGYRIVQWAARARKLAVGATIVQGAKLMGLWLIEAVVFLGVVPWCVGLVWIVIDSFR